VRPVEQALVAIGGRAQRLRGRVDVPVSKAFLPVGGRPLLYWCLRSLSEAGVKRIVLAANNDLQVMEAELVRESIGAFFDDVVVFRDAGLGVHGIPYQAREVLDESFLFEAGHGVADPDHYATIAALKDRSNIVFSAFSLDPHHARPNAPVDSMTVCGGSGHEGRLALAHPMVVDGQYAERLATHRFEIERITQEYLRSGRLVAVVGSFPVEFDVEHEYLRAMSEYEENLRQKVISPTPWPQRPAGRLDSKASSALSSSSSASV
jgi:hypothetical protein